MNRIKELRKSKGLLQSELAEIIGVTNVTVSNWERGQYEPDAESLRALSRCFDVPVDYIVGHNPKADDRSWIPVLGNVAAGVPIEAVERYPDDDDNWEQLDEEMLNDGYEYFALRIKGDSMSPRMQNGDVVIVRKQSDIETDEIAVVKVDGEDATVKKVRLTDDGIWLLPSNPAYEPMYYSRNEEISVLGKVVELRAKF